MKRTLISSILLLSAPLLGCASTSRMAGEQMDDNAIVRRVEVKLAGDPDVSSTKIDVDSLDRQVTLTGTVETEVQKAEAEQIAYDTRGVEKVVNKLIVNPSDAFFDNDPDMWITTKVKSALAIDPDIRTFEIDVDTDNSTVRLSGEVGSDKIAKRAEEIAGEVRGVKGVTNDLEVSEVAEQSEGEEKKISEGDREPGALGGQTEQPTEEKEQTEKEKAEEQQQTEKDEAKEKQQTEEQQRKDADSKPDEQP